MVTGATGRILTAAEGSQPMGQQREGTAVRYQMRQKILSIGDDYWIENAEGKHIYRIDGKVLRLRNTLDLEDLDGNLLCRVQARISTFPRYHGHRRARWPSLGTSAQSADHATEVISTRMA